MGRKGEKKSKEAKLQARRESEDEEGRRMERARKGSGDIPY